MEAIVVGRVQGVSFRAFVEIKARALALKGFVRNLPDGSVEVVAEGPNDKLNALLKELVKGPSLSRVESVKKGFYEPTNEFFDFSIR